MKTKSVASTCPICQQENHCAVAAHQNPTSCWCMTEKIHSEQLTNTIREQAQCICYTCAIQLKNEEQY